MIESMEILVRQLSKGDKKAYAMVFHEFYTPLLLYSIKYTKNQEASEDVVQEFFCTLWEERRKLQDNKSFCAYIYTSVRNRSLNYLRNNHFLPLDEYDKVSEEDLLMELMEEEVYRELYAAIQRLPERCKQIFLLKLDGIDNAEIARRAAVTEETVRSQLRRGRVLLQKELTGIVTLALLTYWNSL